MPTSSLLERPALFFTCPSPDVHSTLVKLQAAYSDLVALQSLNASKHVLPELYADAAANYAQLWAQVKALSAVCLEQSDSDRKEVESILQSTSGVGGELSENEEDSDEAESESELSDLDLERIKETLDDENSQDFEQNSNSPGDQEDSELASSAEESELENANLPEFRGRSTVVDDKFFKLADMESFLEADERGEIAKKYKDEDNDNYLFVLGESGEEEEGVEAKYSDFFDQPYKKFRKVQKSDKKVRFSDVPNGEKSAEGPENGEKNENLSSFERIQQRMELVMNEMQEENLAEKSWQMKGEVSAQKRPENSTLEEHMDFISQSRLPPVITQGFTEKIEKLVKQRIKDRTFDDVARKEKPQLDPSKYKNELILDQQKSKVSLSQIYEDEWLKQKQGDNVDAPPEKRNPAHLEIEKSMRALFAKLDALTHFNFIPMQASTEIQVVKNAPAVTLEEVAPTTLSEAGLLAPEDVKKRPKGDVKSTSEKSSTERKHERRLKKVHQKMKVRKSLGKKKLEDLTRLGKVKKVAQTENLKLVSSADFFGRLDKGLSKPKKVRNLKEKKVADFKN